MCVLCKERANFHNNTALISFFWVEELLRKNAFFKESAGVKCPKTEKKSQIEYAYFIRVLQMLKQEKQEATKYRA